MLSHIHIGVNDFERSFAFYESLLPVLGLELKFKENERPWAGWMMPGKARPLFIVGKPYNGQPAAKGNGQMIALLAPSRRHVDQCYVAAMANGATSEGPPGMRPEYHANY